MKETLILKKTSSSLKETNSSYEYEKNIKKNESQNSKNSSSLESSFNNLNSEIKSIIENETDLSFSSNSNSDIEENKDKIEHFFDSKYWRVSKETNSETDEPISTYESQNDKNTPSKKDKVLFIGEKNSPKPFGSKYAEVQEMARISVGSNKQSTQSNEDEEGRLDHLTNISYCESNNNSPINCLENNESEEKENKKGKIKINIEEANENSKEEVSKDNTNNIKNSNNKLFNNGFNNYNNIQNIKYNNDSEYIYPYEPINYKNNNLPFFQGVYLSQQICSFMPNYNYNLSKKNFIQNNNNKLEEISSFKKKEDFRSLLDKNINAQNNQYIHSYINNMNNYNKKMDLSDLPMVMNQNIPQNNSMNFRYPKINFNMLCCPQIQPSNISIQKPTVEKTNNSSNYLPEINNKENSSKLSEKNVKNSNAAINNNKNTENNNANICPIIEQNNIKKINKNFIVNKNMNTFNNKGNSKGEKQVLNLDDIVTGKDIRTTVMIRNIPIKYTDEILIEDLNEFIGKYDCLYMPYDYEKNGNKGYAFINFVNPLHILYFYEKFNGKKWTHFESSKICELNCAHFQGINEIQKHAKNYKGQKKPSYYARSENNENMIIPSKYLLKLKKRFPKMKYSENKIKKIIIVNAFE